MSTGTARLIRRFAFVACVLGAWGVVGAAEPRPNVVIFSLDTLRADALGVWGEQRPTSPTLDAIATESLVFRDAISQAGVTAPSHMSLLTSLYPTVHRVSNAQVAMLTTAAQRPDQVRSARMDPRIETLATILHRHGWRTAAFVGGGNITAAMGFAAGFDLFDESPDNGFNGNREHLFDDVRLRRWLALHSREPFFLFLHTYIPHAPYLPPPPWDRAFDPDYDGPIPSNRLAFYHHPTESHIERMKRFWGAVDGRNPREVAHLRALYAGDVRYADDAVRSVRNALQKAGVWERSIIVVLSDHGEEFLEHGAFEHPGDLYDELVHVPLLMRLPGGAARSIPGTVQLLDVMPTILQLLGLPVPEYLQGTSLLPLLHGERLPRWAFSETVLAWDVEAAGRRPRRSVRSVRGDRWSYHLREAPGGRREELYDRNADPREQHDRSGNPRYHGKLMRLRRLMERHRAACDALAGRFPGGTLVDVPELTRQQLEALGYVR